MKLTTQSLGRLRAMRLEPDAADPFGWHGWHIDDANAALSEMIRTGGTRASEDINEKLARELCKAAGVTWRSRRSAIQAWFGGMIAAAKGD